MANLTRRGALAAGVVGLASLAGCLGGPDEQTGSTERPERTPTANGREGDEKTETATAAGTQTQTLDLREANVVDVAVADIDDGQQFDVTLYHDDDGEDGYADWWQVETLGGDHLGRRDLAHPHSTDPFTRSATITVPESRDCVVVRGHDQTHGYGGQAMVVSVPGGDGRPVQQGPEPTQFDAEECP